MAKFLRNASIPQEILRSPQIVFVMDVWGALNTSDFARFFRLLRRANLLQACMMIKYVGEVRLSALQLLCATLCPPGNLTGSGVPYPVPALTDLLMFEDQEDTCEFLSLSDPSSARAVGNLTVSTSEGRYHGPASTRQERQPHSPKVRHPRVSGL